MEHTEIGPYGSRWVASSSVANRGAVFWTYVIGPPLVVVAVVIAAAGLRTFERSFGWVTDTREVREHLCIVLSTNRDDAGGVRTILEANNDMTARKIAEVSLRRSSEDELEPGAA